MTIPHKLPENIYNIFLFIQIMQTSSTIRVLLAQTNPAVGDIVNNCQKILDIIKTHHQQHDLIIFPELAICGYPPEDLLLQNDFMQQIESEFKKITEFKTNCAILLGLPRKVDGQRKNAAAYIYQNQVSFYDKQALPNDSVFSESRFFTEGQGPYLYFKIKNHQFGVLICEDIWQDLPVQGILQQPIDSLIAINASPYFQGKMQQRQAVFAKLNTNIIYVNMVGGQDEVVFDGQSMIVDKNHKICAKSPIFKEDLLSVTYQKDTWHGDIAPNLSDTEELYEALKLGLKDFLAKNHISKVVLGLSGGIDSALTLAIASDVLQASNIRVVLMPSPYTATMSIDDAVSQAKTLGVSYDIVPINSFYQQFNQELLNTWQQPLESLTHQNLQARIRGIFLMAYANQYQALLLSTSNKSEAAVGYCTLYGDMCGGFSVIKDVYKTQVYQLAEYVNRHREIIPKRVISRAPSAELAPNQTDQDDLPEYDLLDKLLKDMLENRLSMQQLHDKGYDPQLVLKIYKKIKGSEFKRFQSAPGTKVSAVAFGRDWRFPISNGWDFLKKHHKS